ncbi:Protein of unknown function [Pyronema omphalodes CBS 100304]|uniref:Uncharacterized protein n=1 Tax=Pyronema omphalodes (strain CBS 100304) TaxID=1076935 RepID=U4LA61_PYROM|nr:Protein of unknown function [Pyronema omphalodes CBS 100304]
MRDARRSHPGNKRRPEAPHLSGCGSGDQMPTRGTLLITNSGDDSVPTK